MYRRGEEVDAMQAIKAAAAVVTGALLALATATTAVAAPPLPPTPAITPGIGLATYNATPPGGDTCSAGFLVHTDTGRPGFLTAGHCDHGGPVAYKNAAGNYDFVGTFTDSVHQGNVGEAPDIALVELNASAPTDTRIIGIRPVTGVAHPVRLQVGQTLCKFGLATGLECGAVTEITPTKVAFTAKAAKGDSGGPVYYRNADGTATAVGITIRGNDDGTGAVAELVEPWLDKWHLALDRTPVAPNSLPAAYTPGR
ncbi:S1 family peptidase [Mycobacterium avium]|uniref:S1 family peptidase n=1 Tax=Mycobacterium avium TaxID=1764 RepID=UPI001F26676A|nr:S1 family peptidase [Mycobacterium avium]